MFSFFCMCVCARAQRIAKVCALAPLAFRGVQLEGPDGFPVKIGPDLHVLIACSKLHVCISTVGSTPIFPSLPKLAAHQYGEGIRLGLLSTCGVPSPSPFFLSGSEASRAQGGAWPWTSGRMVCKLRVHSDLADHVDHALFAAVENSKVSAQLRAKNGSGGRGKKSAMRACTHHPAASEERLAEWPDQMYCSVAASCTAAQV